MLTDGSTRIWHGMETWQDISLSPELCARLRPAGVRNPGESHSSIDASVSNDRPAAPLQVQRHLLDNTRCGTSLYALMNISSLALEPQLQPKLQEDARQQLPQQEVNQLPSAALTVDDTATVNSVLQRMIEAVSFRAASEIQAGLIEKMEAKQEAAWEAEFQAQEWQQQLLQQRLRARPTLQRCGPSRSISMPSTSQQYMGQPHRGRCDTYNSPGSCAKQTDAQLPAAVSGSLPSLSENGDAPIQQCQPDPAMPFIRVPSSTSQVHANAATEALSSVGSFSAVPIPDAAHASSLPLHQSSTSSSSGFKPACRHGSDLGLPASKAYQPMLSLAANARTASLHASVLHRNPQHTKSREQTEVVAAARVKAGQMARGAGPSSGKGKMNADIRVLSQSTCKGSQGTSITRPPVPSLSRPLSLPASRSTFKESATGSVLLSNVPNPPVGHASLNSSREFYAQPTAGSILAVGAPAVLQKKILELMRRQSDTVKWEQKNSRGLSIALA